MRRDPNLDMVERVADALGSLRDRMVFLGGSATGLLLTDPAAASIRATKDVDVIVEVSTQSAYSELEHDLGRLGFRHDRSEDAPVCRWRFEGLVVDVMPTDPGLLGFSNRWYPEAVRSSVIRELPSGRRIRLVAAPCFLATKLEAFFGRGKGDFLGSPDLEDMVAVVDGRPELLEEVRASPPALQRYLAGTLAQLLESPTFRHSIQGHLPPDLGSQGRLPDVLDRIRALAQLKSPS